jgi:hypothetical protein
MLRDQAHLVPPASAPPSLHTRYGHATTAIGVTATIFVIFSIISSSMLGSVGSKQLQHDLEWVLRNDSVENLLDSADAIATGLVPADASLLPSFEVAAVDAEHRAVQRARRGVAAARAFALHHGLSPAATVRTILDWFLRAAWPSGLLLTERTHVDVLRMLESPEFYLQPPNFAANDGDVFELVPLAQLTALSAGGGGASDSDASSVRSSVRTFSSGASSVADRGDLGIESLLVDAIVSDFQAVP